MIEQKIFTRRIVGDETAFSNHVLECFPLFGWSVNTLNVIKKWSHIDDCYYKELEISCSRDNNMPNYDTLANLFIEFDRADRKYYYYNTRGREKDVVTDEKIEGQPNPAYFGKKEPETSGLLAVVLLFAFFPAFIIYLIYMGSQKSKYNKKLKEAEALCEKMADEFYDKTQDLLDQAEALIS